MNFTTTHWSVVLEAGRTDSGRALVALERLCQDYWYPLYAFIRRRGHSREDAEDLTQSFFAFLMERKAIKSVDREKGRFRTFLLAALTNFLNNELDRRHAAKRGGRHEVVSWDEAEAEDRYRLEPVDRLTPEKLFERRWAFTVVEQVLARLQQEYEESGRLGVFEALQPFLTGEVGPTTHAELAAALKSNEGAVKVALHRLRRRFGECLRRQIAETVAQPEEVEEEIRHLLAALTI